MQVSVKVRFYLSSIQQAKNFSVTEQKWCKLEIEDLEPILPSKSCTVQRVKVAVPQSYKLQVLGQKVNFKLSISKAVCFCWKLFLVFGEPHHET